MQIVSVAGIGKGGIMKEMLSYYATEPVSVGDLVRVPYRNGYLQGIIVDQVESGDVKMAVKQAHFSLKGVREVLHAGLIHGGVITAAIETARLYHIPVTSVLRSVLPKILWEDIETWGVLPRCAVWKKPRVFICMQTRSHRYDVYRQHIRERFAKGVSVVIVLPTLSKVLRVATELDPKLQERTLIHTGGDMTIKERARVKAMVEKGDPILVFCTPMHASLFAQWMPSFIFEDEGSHHYITDFPRRFDTREYLERLAFRTGADCIFGGSLLRPTVYHGVQKYKYEYLLPFPTQVRSEVSVLYIQKPKEDAPRAFPEDDPVSIIFPETKEHFQSALAQKKHVLIYTPTKGYARVTVCQDCSATMGCPTCGRNLVSTKKHFMVCPTCGVQGETTHLCPTCGGHNCVVLGFGIERVIHHIRHHFPSVPIIQIDGDNTKTPRAVRTALTRAEQEPSIIIGTSMVFGYLPENIGVSSIISLESLLAPRGYDTMFQARLLLKDLCEHTHTRVLVQHRGVHDSLRERLENPVVRTWYEQELSERESLGYPPFYVHVWLSPKESHTKSNKDKLENFLSPLPLVWGSFMGKPACRVSIEREEWYGYVRGDQGHDTILRMVQAVENGFEITVIA